MTDYNEETMRNNLFEILDDLTDSLSKETPGSDKHTALIKDIDVMVRAVNSDYQTANTIEKDRAHAALEERKFLEESRQREREFELREEQAIAGGKWYRQPIVQYLIGTTILTSGTVFMAVMNVKTETPLINSVAQGMSRLLGAVDR